MRKLAIAVLFALSVLASCTERTIKEELSDTAIFGQHELVKTERTISGQGQFHGSFYFGIGSIEGNFNSGAGLLFFWSPKPKELIACSLPFNKFNFVIDESRDIPTIEFVFNPLWLERKLGFEEEIFISKKANLNNFILSQALQVAVVRISQKTMEKEIYLPKMR